MEPKTVSHRGSDYELSVSLDEQSLSFMLAQGQEG